MHSSKLLSNSAKTVVLYMDSPARSHQVISQHEFRANQGSAFLPSTMSLAPRELIMLIFEAPELARNKHYQKYPLDLAITIRMRLIMVSIDNNHSQNWLLLKTNNINIFSLFHVIIRLINPNAIIYSILKFHNTLVT